MSNMGIFPKTKTGKFKDDFTLYKAIGAFEQLTKWKPEKICKGSIVMERPNGAITELLFWYGPEAFATHAYEYRDKEALDAEHARWKAQHRAIRRRVMRQKRANSVRPKVWP